MRISDWSSDVCSSDLDLPVPPARTAFRWRADPAGAGRGVDLSRRPGVRRAHPRVAQDAAQEKRQRGVRDPVAGRHPALGDRAGAGRQLSEPDLPAQSAGARSEEHTSELQSLMRISYAVFCLKKKKKKPTLT